MRAKLEALLRLWQVVDALQERAKLEALPGQEAAGACLVMGAGESSSEGLGYGCLECLMLEQLLVDCMRSPSAVLLDVF